MITIKSVNKITTGVWIAHYVSDAPCGCCGNPGERQSIVINSVDKPTQKQIDDEITNKRKGVQPGLGNTGNRQVLPEHADDGRSGKSVKRSISNRKG